MERTRYGTDKVLYGHGMVRTGYDTATVRTRYGTETVWYGHGMARTRYGTETVWYGKVRY